MTHSKLFHILFTILLPTHKAAPRRISGRVTVERKASQAAVSCVLTLPRTNQDMGQP